MTYPNGRQEDYGYNSGIDTTISRISTIADHGGSSSGTVAAYTYLGLSTIVQESQPQINAELTYIQVPGDTLYNADGGDRYRGLDRFGHVIDQAYYVTTSPPSVPQFLDRVQYAYDRDGNVLYANNLVNGSFSELYHANSASSGDNSTAYDPLSRLTNFSRGTLTSSGNNGSTLDTITSANLDSTTGVPNQNSWNLDALGNWDSGAGSTNTFNAQNEETANGSNTLTYDNAGGMTKDELGNTYTFDAWGHVVQINNSSGATLETFQYDALGRNVQVNNGSGFDTIAYDAAGRQVQSSFGSTYVQNVWGLAYINDLLLRDRNQDGNTSTGNLGFTGSGLEEREYAQHDKQFSVISITDSSGSVIQRIVYDPYGNPTLLTASWAYDANHGGTNYWIVYFQGMTLVADGTSGNMLQSQTRLYNTNLGRWTSQDWARYVDGVNLYGLEAENPIASFDPFGTTATKPETHKLPGNNGTFVTIITAFDSYDRGDLDPKTGQPVGPRSGVSMNIHYEPNNKCASCSNIEIIQVVRTVPRFLTDDTQTYPWDVDWVGKYYTAAQLAEAGIPAYPFYANPVLANRLPNWGHGGSNTSTMWQDAVIDDVPNVAVRSYGATYVQFQDYVVCVDTGKVLDAMSWGYFYLGNYGIPSVDDQSLVAGTTNLQQALNAWNTTWPNRQFHAQ